LAGINELFRLTIQGYFFVPYLKGIHYTGFKLVPDSKEKAASFYRDSST